MTADSQTKLYRGFVEDGYGAFLGSEADLSILSRMKIILTFEVTYPIDTSMVGKYKVITLCGSTKFKEQYIEAQKRLTLEGNIVISVGLFGHSGDDEVWTEGTKAMLDDMHKRKIDMADEIFVINVGGYIGESTRSEIAYAKSQGIEVRYLEKI